MKTLTLPQRNILVFINLLVGFLFLLFPLFVFSQGVTNGITYECVSGGVYGNCDINDLILAIQNLVNKIVPLVLGFTVVIIAYAGFKYMISGDNPGERAAANKMLRSVAIGIFFIIAAWLIVTLIANTLVSGSVPRLLNNQP